MALVVLGAISAFCLIAGFWPEPVLMSFVLWVVRAGLILNGCVFLGWTVVYAIWLCGKPVEANQLLHRDDPHNANDEELECNGGWVGPEGNRHYEQHRKEGK